MGDLWTWSFISLVEICWDDSVCTTLKGVNLMKQWNKEHQSYNFGKKSGGSCKARVVATLIKCLRVVAYVWPKIISFQGRQGEIECLHVIFAIGRSHKFICLKGGRGSLLQNKNRNAVTLLPGAGSWWSTWTCFNYCHLGSLPYTLPFTVQLTKKKNKKKNLYFHGYHWN